MNLGELAWGEYQKGVSRKILGLARRIIEKQKEGLGEFLESPEFGALSKSSQIKFQEELKDLYKILERLESSFSSGELLSLDISELSAESESKIKQAISEAAKRLRPLDQKGILGALQSQRTDESQSREKSIGSETFSKMGEEKIDELLHSGKMPEIQGKILEILIGLLGEIRKIRVSTEVIPRELREIRMLFAKIERQGGFK